MDAEMADVQRIEGIPLRQRAAAAYAAELRAMEAERERLREQQRQADIEDLRWLLRRALGLHADVVDRVGAPVVEIDGVLLGVERFGRFDRAAELDASLYEYRRCAACGQRFPLRAIDNMADLATPYTGGATMCADCEDRAAEGTDDDADG